MIAWDQVYVQVRYGPILNYDMRTGPIRVNQRTSTALTHHTDLVDSIVRHDAEGARKALESDIQSAADFIISVGALISADEALS